MSEVDFEFTLARHNNVNRVYGWNVDDGVLFLKKECEH